MVKKAPTHGRAFEILRDAVAGACLTVLTACGAANTDLPAQTRLPEPGNVTAQTNDLNVTLSWEPVSGASSYIVYWAQGSTVTTHSGTRAEAPSPPYVHQASTFDVTYAYIVVALDTRGLPGRVSSVVTVTPTGQAQEAPRHVVVTAGDGRTIINWDLVSGASGYEISGTNQFGPFSVPDPGLPPFVHTRLSNRIEYRYQVRAKFGVTVGPWSTEVAAIPMPAVPGSPVFIDVRALIRTDADPVGTLQGAIQLSWLPTVDADEYQVYVTTEPNGLAQPLIDPGGFPLKDTSYRHTPVTFGVTYTYRVEAINEGVPSPPITAGPGSNPALLTPDKARAFVPFPLAPGAIYSYVVRSFNGSTESADVTVASIEPSGAPYARDLSWTPPSGSANDRQRLYRAATVIGPYELIATFTDLIESAYRDAGNPQDPTPTGLTVTQQTPDLLVSWSPINNAASGYRLYWWQQAPGEAIGAVQVLTTSYQHTGLQSGSTYIYAVQVEGRAGVSPNVSGVAP